MVRSEHTILQKILISKIKGKDDAYFVFDRKGVILHEHAPEGQTVNATFTFKFWTVCVSILPV